MLMIAVAACAAPTASPSRQPASNDGLPSATPPSRTVVMAIRVEPDSLAAKGPRQVGVSLHATKRLFNAELDIEDQRGEPVPYLATQVPQLNTDSWKVFPDGRMETTWKLKPNLRWHDGTALSAEDFVFAWRVYRTPDLGYANSAPLNQMEEVGAPDASTVVVRWLRAYPDANLLVEDAFPPLPRHVLQTPFEEQSLEAFTALSYWTRDFIGLGPFRLDRWEPGAFIEASAFDGHVLGAPKISRMRIIFIGDTNTTLANLLSGEVHVSGDLSLGFRQAVTLKRQWEPQQGGGVILHPNQWRATKFQLRPDVANPRAILDVRVRKAISHAIDKQALNDSIYEGEGIIAETMLAPMEPFYRAVESAIVKYAHNPRLSEQLMNEAGFRKGPGDMFVGPDGRLALEIKTNASAEFESEMAVLASQMRQAGFDTQESVLPTAQSQDPQVRASFPSMFTHSSGLGIPAVIDQVTNRIPTADNRWNGGNRGGWSNFEYDRLVETFNGTLDRTERERLLAQMIRIHTDEAASIGVVFATQPLAHVAALRGPQIVPPGSVINWDIHTWHWAE